jgi:hypothetical protein
MRFRERILKILGGDKLTVDPETPVALIAVRDFMAPLVVEALRDAGIVASAVDERSALWTGESLQSRSTIFVPAGRRDEALAIVNEVVGFDAAP